jgi:hypothetical protein
MTQRTARASSALRQLMRALAAAAGSIASRTTQRVGLEATRIAQIASQEAVKAGLTPDQMRERTRQAIEAKTRELAQQARKATEQAAQKLADQAVYKAAELTARVIENAGFAAGRATEQIIARAGKMAARLGSRRTDRPDRQLPAHAGPSAGSSAQDAEAN